jgi:hypothetical protein
MPPKQPPKPRTKSVEVWCVVTPDGEFRSDRFFLTERMASEYMHMRVYPIGTDPQPFRLVPITKRKAAK